MAFTKSRRVAVVYTPAALANENKQLYAVPAGWIVADVITRNRVAGDGNGTLSLGTTSGGTDLNTTGNAAITATGIKVAGVANRVGYAADGFVWANYTVGTATIKPVVVVSFTLINAEV